MSSRAIKFVLVGPNAGKTIEFNNRRFVDGEHTHFVRAGITYPEELRLVTRSMGHYGAYVHGSDAHEHAEATWATLQAGLPTPELVQPPEAPPEDEGTEPEAQSFLNIKLVEAIKSLDPDNDKHWNASGLPMIVWVEKAYGQGGLNRRTVTEALPDWSRAAAALAKTAEQPDPTKTEET